MLFGIITNFFLAFGLMFQTLSWAQSSVPKNSSNFKIVFGRKYPNSLAEGVSPAESRALAPQDFRRLRGFTELLAYVTPSPDQENAGTCLFMSLTGMAEWWLMRLNHSTQFLQDGPFDLSERWWAALSLHEKNKAQVKNWNTDGIFLLNTSAAVLNRNYRFTKSWYFDKGNELLPAPPHASGALYDTRYNWIDQSDQVQSGFVKLPRFFRRIIYADPKSNPWQIGQAPHDIVELVKQALVREKSPVQVIYNHLGYWHSVFVLGFDDEASSNGCSFLQESLRQFSVSDGQSSAQLGRRLGYARQLKEALRHNGGCHPRGVFYVRDSLYSDPSEPVYHYDLSNPAADKPYSKRIILREYDWLRTLANHVNVISIK